MSKGQSELSQERWVCSSRLQAHAHTRMCISLMEDCLLSCAEVSVCGQKSWFAGGCFPMVSWSPFRRTPMKLQKNLPSMLWIISLVGTVFKCFLLRYLLGLTLHHMIGGGGVYSPITNHRIHRGLAETPGRPRVRANLKGLSSQTALSPILIGPDLGMLVSQVHGEHIRLALLHSIVQGQFRDKN